MVRSRGSFFHKRHYDDDTKLWANSIIWRTFFNSSSSTLKYFGMKSFSRSQGMRCDGAGNCIKLQKSCKNIWMMNEKDKFPGLRKIMKENSWKFIVFFIKLSSFSRFFRNHVELEALDLETIGSSWSFVKYFDRTSQNDSIYVNELEYFQLQFHFKGIW